MAKRNQVLSFLFSLSVITYIDRTCISLVAADMKADLGIQNDTWGWVLSAFALSYALFELPTGTLGDRQGPRRVLTRVVIWWSAFTALTGTAFNWLNLVIVRFLFGAGEAGAYPNASIVVSRWFPKQETGRAQAVIWAAGRVGGSLAPWIVIPIATYWGWRVSFFAMAFFGLIWALAWYFWFRDFPAQQQGISAEELSYIEANRRFRSSDHHIPWQKILRSPNMWALMLMFHFYMYGAYFFTGWLPTYLKEGRHFDKSEMQLFATLPFVLGAIGCLIGGYLSDWLSKRYGLRVGRRTLGIVGMGASSLIILLAALSPENTTSAYLLAAGMGFKDLTLPVAFAVCVDIGKSRSGTVSGAMNMVGQMGAVFLGVLFGYIVKATGNFNYPLYLIAFLLLLACLLWLLIDPEKEMDF
jgi:MFS transporter, ACS family, glucarate transporter